MSNSILVTGANGQLGSELRVLKENGHIPTKNSVFYFTDVAELDITDINGIETYCVEKKINIIINCSAYTAVDKAEEEFDLADKINHIGVRNLASVSEKLNIKLIHISTDYVFDGHNYKPYVETDNTCPQSVYGKTKLAGEKAILDIQPNAAVIIRTSWLYSSFGNNFVKTMLRLGKEKQELGVVSDQVGTPTYAKDLAEVILIIIGDRVNHENSGVQIYHYSNDGVCSWYDFAHAIFEYTNIECTLNPVNTIDYPTPAKRPLYSLLDKHKIKKEYNVPARHWRTSLSALLSKIV